jgi:hypothetical protein
MRFRLDIAGIILLLTWLVLAVRSGTGLIHIILAAAISLLLFHGLSGNKYL